MEQVTKTATVSTAYGSSLKDLIGKDSLEFSFSYEELEKGDDIPEKEVPDADELLSYVNQKRAASARSTAQAKVLTDAGVKKPDLSQESVQISTMKKVFMALKNTDGSPRYTETQAEAAARVALQLA